MFFFRFRKAERDHPTVILTQRRIYILPTRTGLLFVLVLVLMLTGAINYSLSLGHALVFLLAGLFFVAIIHTFRNLLDLRVTPGAAAPVFAGERAEFPVFLENTRPHDRIALEFSLPASGTSSAARANIAANASLTIAVSLEVLQRGLFRPERLTLSSCYPLGLFRAWTHLYPDISCLVYPRPLRTPMPAPSGGNAAMQWQGENGQDDFAGLRQRQPNESFRRVAWKTAARDPERPLLNKQFSGGGERELILDWSSTPSQSGTETRLSILAGWILESEKQQVNYGLRLPECFFAPSRGTPHRDACLKALALYA
ncbi:MAG: DUF58 domain-containing protein [Candidatus Accumulibacter sp.]|jgi:uncharacterized protein (DUF58 family)|nr:DUF58 domain-containing protein [Accumulibacter sp.]